MKLLRSIKETVKHFFYNMKWFFINIYNYRKTLWENRPWDQEGIYVSLRDTLVVIKQSMINHDHKDNKEKIKDLNVCITLINRILEDEYLKMDYIIPESGDIFGGRFKHKYFLPKGSLSVNWKLDDNLKKQDIKLLFKIINSKSGGWWN